jgi:hypothetical protein
MGKRLRRKAITSGPTKHVRLYRYLLWSDAYRSLGLPARCLLVELYDLYNGENNGHLFMSVREAARRLGISKNTAHTALKQLEDRGFIRPNQRSSFHWKKRQATCWVLTEYEFAGHAPSKEFMRWSAPQQNQNTVPLDETYGPNLRDRDMGTVQLIVANGPP